MKDTVSSWQAWRTVLRNDLRLALRQRTDILTPLVFFIIVVSLFPLGVGPESKLLHAMGAGVIWVAALLANLLSLHRIFENELENGMLEQLLLAPHSLALLVSAKILSHWLTSGLPLVILTPLLSVQMGLTGTEIGLMVITLLIGTPTLSLIGSLGAALTLGLRGGGVLLSLLVLPLYTPILIFGAGAITSWQNSLGVEGHLSLLGAIAILALMFVPWVCAHSLRISLD
jgi:heme exporter protein B